MTIKSKMALELAKKEFGERAAIQQVSRERGKHFGGHCLVGVSVFAFGTTILHVKGAGKSWEAALRDAGVEIPKPLLGTPSMENEAHTDAENGGEE